MGLVAFVAAAAAAVAVQTAPVRNPQPLPDPAAEPVRVEVRVTTAARTVRLFIREPDTVLLAADARLVAGVAPAQAAIENGGVLALTNNAEGSEAIATFRLVLASDAATSVRFGVGIAPAARSATIEVLNLNTESQPARVTAVDAMTATEIETSMAPLRTGGPLPTGTRRDRLVLAHFYPWWERPTWSSPDLLDQPLQLYSTDEPADVARVLKNVAAAGIDAVIVSFQGSERARVWNRRRLQIVLDAAQQAGVRVSVQIETLAANVADVEGRKPDVPVLVAWIADVLDSFGSHPAFLKVDGRPVIWAYAWDYAGEDTWRAVLATLRGSGRTPLVMADSMTPAQLAVADGESTYAGTLFAPDVHQTLHRLVAAQRTWHLLGSAYGSPRIAAASVIPGYDETRIPGRSGRSVDRRGGAFYDGQWQAALASGADWVVITSWNEWAENTEIEAGQRFGEYYVWRTRFWSAAFIHAPR
jgi:hypothetical protein